MHKINFLTSCWHLVHKNNQCNIFFICKNSYNQQPQTTTQSTRQQTGLSPLSPGQRTPFLALYAGFTVALNILRPARFAFAMAISPYFERLRNFIQRKLGVSARMSALVMILCINIVGSCVLMGAGVGAASLLSGVPVWRTVGVVGQRLE
jgi:hypothetical protein